MKNCCKAEGRIYADPQALAVAVMNCLKNALDAYLMRKPNNGSRPPRIIVACGFASRRRSAAVSAASASVNPSDITSTLMCL